LAVHPTRNSAQSPLAAFDQVVWSVFQSLIGVPLVFLAVNTAAVLAVNLLYGPASLRPRYQWHGVVARNAIFGVLFIIAYFVCRSKAGSRDQLPPRFVSIKTRMLRISAWLLLAILAAIETITLATNLVLDRQLTLIKTPSQTLNLCHAVLLAAVAMALLFRTRAATSEGKLLAADLRSLITATLWYGLRKSLVYSVLYAMVFAAGAFLVFKWFVEGRDPQTGFLISHFVTLAGIYVVLGLLCGAHAGAVAAIRDKIPDLMKLCDGLGAPLIRAVVANIALDRGADRAAIRDMIDRLKGAAQSPPGGFLGRLAQRRLTEFLHEGGMIDLIEHWSGQNNSGAAKEALVGALREKLIRLTTDQMEQRLNVVRGVIHAITTVLLLSPALLFVL
jgi:hypothetical protein